MEEAISINEDTTPPNRKEDSVRQLCKIAFFCPVKFEELESQTNDQGKVLRIFRFQVRMTSYGSSVEFEIRYDGKSLGEQKVDVQFEDYQPALPLSLSGLDLSASAASHYRSVAALGLEPGKRSMSPALRKLPSSHHFAAGSPPEMENKDQRAGRFGLGERTQNSPTPLQQLASGHRRGTRDSHGVQSPPNNNEKPGSALFPRGVDGKFLAELPVPYYGNPPKPSSTLTPAAPKKTDELVAEASKIMEKSPAVYKSKEIKPERSGLFSRFKRHSQVGPEVGMK